MLFKILTTVLLAFPLLASACSLTVSSIVNFGTYDPLSTSPNSSVGQVQVTCPDSFTVSLDQGSSGTYTQRTLVSGPHTIGYNLFLNPSYSTVWGDGSADTGIISNSGPSCVEGCSFNVYSRIPARQLSAYVGSYTDSIMVTVNY
jgi:spore coat protein U-like protein